MKNAIPKLTVLALITMLPLNSISFAQSPTGILTGRVLDEKGAVISKARLTLIEQDTNVKQQAETGENGNFSFLSLSPGRYTLIVESDGFTKKELTALKVSVGQTESFYVTLKAGGISEVVSIKSDDLLEQTRIKVDGFPPTDYPIDNKQVSRLPLLTRNPYELVSLIAGAAVTSEARGIGLAVNGQRGASGNYVLDGGENNNVFSGGAAQQIPLDSVQELNVFTNAYGAEYGRSSGFVANIVSMKGINTFHGNLYAYNRNSALAANNFGFNAFGLPRPQFNRNQFGGAIGGYIKKDKVFFFANLEPIIVRSTGSIQVDIPTQQLLDISSPASQAIFNRTKELFKLSSVLPNANDIKEGRNPGQLFEANLCAYNAARDQNGRCLQTTAVPYLARTFVTGPRNNGAGLPQNTFLGSTRIDYTINQNANLYGRYALERDDFLQRISSLTPYIPELGFTEEGRSHNLILNLVKVLPNKWVLESRALYGRISSGYPGNGEIGSDEYLPSLSTLTSSTFTSSGITTTQGFRLPSGYEAFGGVQNLYQFYETASFTTGNHQIKFGGQYEHIRDNRRIFFSIARGINSRSVHPFGGFTSTFVRNGSITPTQNFVDGNMYYYVQVDSNTPPFTGRPSNVRHYHNNESSLFVQDTWKISDRLTLSAGLRWEYFGVFHSVGEEIKFDRNFYYGEGNNIFERIRNGNFLNTSEAPGKYKGHFYLPDYNNFAPRLSLAYDLFGKGRVILRSGVGIFYDRNFAQVQGIVNQNATDYFQAYYSRINLGSNLSLLERPYPVQINSPQSSTFESSFRGQIDQNLRTAYTVSWNAGIQTQIKGVALNASYIGASGNGLYSLNVLNRFGSGELFGDPNTQLFPQAGIITSLSNLGHSTYQSMQLRAERRVRDIGLEFGVNYTYSHSIDNVSSVLYDDNLANIFGLGFLDPFDPNIDRSDSDFDIRHRLVTNFVWDIPAISKSNKWYIKQLVNGWSVSGILSFQSGQPFTLYDTTTYDSYVTLRPQFRGDLPRRQKTPINGVPNSFLYIPVNDCFSGEGPFYCADLLNGPFSGSLPRNIFRRPSTQYHNLALMKDFNIPVINERARLQIRAEFYNPFNHANLYVDPLSTDIYIQQINGLSGITVRKGTGLGIANTNGLQSFIDNRQIVIGVKLVF